MGAAQREEKARVIERPGRSSRRGPSPIQPCPMESVARYSTAESSTPAAAGIFRRSGSQSPSSIMAAPRKCRMPNRMRSEGMTSRVTAVTSRPQRKVFTPRRKLLREYRPIMPAMRIKLTAMYRWRKSMGALVNQPEPVNRKMYTAS